MARLQFPPSVLVAEACAVIGSASAGFSACAETEALRAAAWCGDTPSSAFVLLGHCAACWTDGAAAGIAALGAVLVLRQLVWREPPAAATRRDR